VNLQRVAVGLIVAAVGLPIALCVLYALARLLEAMKDLDGANALGRVNLALFALWVVNLVTLIIVSAMNSLSNPPPGSTPSDQ
jgi:hypothetical protein